MSAERDDLDSLPWDGGAAPTLNGATGRTCTRHRWAHDGTQRVCAKCGKPWDVLKSRQGKRNRRHGNDMERAVATALGGTRVGQFGTLTDVETRLYDVQVKVGNRFPGWIADILDGMPRTATKRRVLACFDSPGPGKKRRGIVVELWDDWAEEHGR